MRCIAALGYASIAVGSTNGVSVDASVGACAGVCLCAYMSVSTDVWQVRMSVSVCDTANAAAAIERIVRMLAVRDTVGIIVRPSAPTRPSCPVAVRLVREHPSGSVLRCCD